MLRLVQILVVLLLQDACRGLGVAEERLDLLNVLAADRLLAVDAGEQERRREQLHGVPQRGLVANLRQQLDRLVVDGNALRVCPNAQNLNNK